MTSPAAVSTELMVERSDCASMMRGSSSSTWFWAWIAAAESGGAAATAATAWFWAFCKARDLGVDVGKGALFGRVVLTLPEREVFVGECLRALTGAFRCRRRERRREHDGVLGRVHERRCPRGSPR